MGTDGEGQMGREGKELGGGGGEGEGVEWSEEAGGRGGGGLVSARMGDGDGRCSYTKWREVLAGSRRVPPPARSPRQRGATCGNSAASVGIKRGSARVAEVGRQSSSHHRGQARPLRFRVERYFPVGVTPHPFIAVPVVGGPSPSLHRAGGGWTCPTNVRVGCAALFCPVAGFHHRRARTDMVTRAAPAAGLRWPRRCHRAAPRHDDAATPAGGFSSTCARPHPAVVAAPPFPFQVHPPKAPLCHSTQAAPDTPCGSPPQDEITKRTLPHQSPLACKASNTRGTRR